MTATAEAYHDHGPEDAPQRAAGRHGSRFESRRCTLISRALRCSPERGRMDIPEWRKKIDELDEQIVRLLSERAAAAVAIGQLKAKDSAPIYEPQREQAVFEHVRRVNPGPLSGAQVQDVYERLMDVMRALQRPQ
jgi:chorismate mutase